MKTTSIRLLLLFSILTQSYAEDNTALEKRIIGEWQCLQGIQHIEAFYADGGYALEPQPGDKPDAKWKIKGNMLYITRNYVEVEKIIEINENKMILEVYNRRFEYKRVKNN